jgi:hypothetical protein
MGGGVAAAAAAAGAVTARMTATAKTGRCRAVGHAVPHTRSSRLSLIVMRPSVYLLAMELTRPTLLQRCAATLRAKQFVVFYAIALYALGVATPLLTGWLREHRPAQDLLQTSSSPLSDLAATRSWLIAVVVAGFYILNAWFRAGYIRSLVGRRHLRPVGMAQFGRLLALALLLDGAFGALTGLTKAQHGAAATELLLLALLLLSLVGLYADYAIVVSNIGPLTGIYRSLQTVRARLGLSAGLVVLAVLFFQGIDSLLTVVTSGSLAAIAPVLVIRVFVLGSLTFVLDVVLVLIYIEAIETGKIPSGHA